MTYRLEPMAELEGSVRNGPCKEFPGYWVVECGSWRSDYCGFGTDEDGGAKRVLEAAKEQAAEYDRWAFISWRANSFDARWGQVGFSGVQLEGAVLPDGRFVQPGEEP